MPSPHAPRRRVSAESVALAFAGVPYSGTPEHVARSCVEAVRALAGGGVHLRIPSLTGSLSVGDPVEDLVCVTRFRTAEGGGELWIRSGGLDDDARQALHDHLTRVWSAQADREQLNQEVERLRFHLGALQQVARTLAVVRGVEETEKLILDFVREMFFAWWGALYRPQGADTYVCRAERSLRGDEIPSEFPASLIREVLPSGGAPYVPDAAVVAQLRLPKDVAVVAPLQMAGKDPVLFVLGPRMNEQPYDANDLGLLRTVADSSAIALQNARSLDRLRTQASVDPLTGCLNRRGFDDRLEAEITRFQRYRRSLSVLLLDLDHFKALNDEWGHNVGDNALKRVGGVLAQALRATDSVCRHGGEEFAILLPETSKADATTVADRLRRMVAALPVDAEMPRGITASFGVASLPDDAADGVELLRAADQALYRAKVDGRDCVRAAGGE